MFRAIEPGSGDQVAFCPNCRSYVPIPGGRNYRGKAQCCRPVQRRVLRSLLKEKLAGVSGGQAMSEKAEIAPAAAHVGQSRKGGIGLSPGF